MYDFFHAGETIGSSEWNEKTDHETRSLLDLLGVSAGASWLDVPCGTGRHCVRLAGHGLRVTGIDISDDCITLARNENAHPLVQYVRGDMSKLGKFKARFDVVSNLFTSLGYFTTDEENQRVLKGMVACLKGGGKLVIHIVNRERLLDEYSPSRWEMDGDILFVESNRFDSKSKYFESCVVYLDKRTGRAKNYYYRIRLYSKPEMVRLFKAVGLRNIQIYGDFDGTPFDKLRSLHPVFVGER